MLWLPIKKTITKYQSVLALFKAKRARIEKIIFEKETLEKEHEYHSFLLTELLNANLMDGEQELLEQELEQLSNVEFIKENFERILAFANEEQVGVLVNLKEIKLALQKNSPFAENYAVFK